MPARLHGRALPRNWKRPGFNSRSRKGKLRKCHANDCPVAGHKRFGRMLLGLHLLNVTISVKLVGHYF